MTKPFQPGEACLLVDARGRHYLVTLAESGEFQYHAGTLAHSEIIGSAEGTSFHSTAKARLTAFRPRLADYILRMKRGAQVIYPKDLGSIIIWADIGAGMNVVEAGTGSGALAMALARAVGPSGKVTSVEVRPDHAAHARKVIGSFFGAIPENLDLRVGDVSDVIPEVGPDRLVLDLPTPVEVVPAAIKGLQPGGVFCAYLPTVPQVQKLRDEFRNSGAFGDAEIFEVLHRDWVADGRSVRPDHRMVGHTGFIVVARKLNVPAR